MLAEKGESERGAVRETEDALEGAFRVDDVVEEVVCSLHGSLVFALVLESSGPVVVAVVGTLEDVFDARTGAAADLATNVDKRCAVVFLQVADHTACVECEQVDTTGF